ncbi:gonadotropin-releasing hormone II receptor-like [Rhinatrema bivittatum]|uniref:gonadotropin-releasing hormone II receptor-like n=1 Tax=Rhinatrema bivittatum TaxID=194408 RepID=UPI001129F52A|nr:gonadotropin-releasing hormone II receptor-like [Rhinatrema bivittatum]
MPRLQHWLTWGREDSTRESNPKFSAETRGLFEGVHQVQQKVMTEQLHFLNGTHHEDTPDTNLSAVLSRHPWMPPTFTATARARVIVTGCLFLIAALSNVTVLCSILRKRRKSHIRVLILSLTVADLLVTCLVMPLDAVWNVTVQWYAGELLCKVLNFFKLFAMYSAALVLVVISLDRHSAILYPFSFANASRRNRIMLCVAWSTSFLLASPQMFLFRLHSVPGMNFTQCVTHGSFQERWQETVYNMFTFTTLFVTPLCVMAVCYVRILCEISTQLKDKKGLARSKNEHICKARMKTLKMTIVIVASFIVCWTPYYLLGLWYWFQPDMIQETPEYIHRSLFLFGLLHTCSDPLIYGLYTPSFWEDVTACCRRMGSVSKGQRADGKPLSCSELNINDGATADSPNGTDIQTVF